MPVLTKINTNSIAEDAITGDKFAADTYLANTATQNISGTYSESRLYTSDAYTLSGNATINSHLTLSSVKPTADVVLTAGGAYTITGTGVLSAGSLLAKERSDLTGMTGELGTGVTLGSAVTGTPAITGLGTVTSGSIGSTVTGYTGIKSISSLKCSDFVASGTTDPITTWSVTAILGSPVTHSSGVISFPTTGFWEVDVRFSFYTNNNTAVSAESINCTTYYTTNNGSSWTGHTAAHHNLHTSGNDWWRAQLHSTAIFDITDIGQQKVKFVTGSSAGTLYQAASGNVGGILIKRLGDT